MDHHHAHDMDMDHNMDMGANTSDDIFCFGTGHVMMNGFQVAIGATQPCALFLFPGWVLDSGGKYAAACFGAFLMPTILVLIQLLRQRVLTASGSASSVGKDALQAVCYGIQMMFAYFLMLLVMLYESVIFLSICLGFVVSFFLLQRCEKGKASTEAADAIDKNITIDAPPCCSPP